MFKYKVTSLEEKSNGYLWENGFPPLYSHTSISRLKHCPGFSDAKQGNMQAALLVAGVSVKSERIKELREKYPSAVLLPVMTKNKLPEAFAWLIGLKVCLDVREVQSFKIKNLSAMERLLHKPQFRGTITKGESYIIVDDIVTQGCTISALRQFVLSRGGSVAAVTALAYAAGSGAIAPGPERVRRLAEKPGYPHMLETLRFYHIAEELGEMTDSQIKYLLRFKNTEQLVKKINMCLR